MPELKNGVIAIKVKSDKESLKALCYQIAQITTKCVHYNIKVTDVLVTYGGTKDVLREVKKADKKNDFEYLIVYAPTQIAKTAAEYDDFVDAMKNEFKVEVLSYRQGV